VHENPKKSRHFWKVVKLVVIQEIIPSEGLLRTVVKMNDSSSTLGCPKVCWE